MILENPTYLYWLFILIPLGGILYLWIRRNRKRKRSIYSNDVRDRFLEKESFTKHILPKILLILSPAFLIIALANPLGKPENVTVERRATDIMFALDISRSMLAEDIRPSRLQRAKIVTQELIRNLPSERLGLIVFAADAYVSMPLSTDHSAAKMFLQAANPLSTSNQGTSIGKAIEEYMNSIEEENQRHRVMIILSDGESHDENAIEMAKAAREKNISVFTIGVGTKEGAEIPVKNNGRSFTLRNNSGLIVKTKYSPEFLKSLAQAGGGTYYDILAGTRITGDLKTRIDEMEKQKITEMTIDSRTSYFQIPLAIGIIFLLLGVILSEKIIKT